jgi:SNF2 family DNA or RNA helicase
MEGRERYQVGERILHSTFGNGLVVEVRDRGFYDVLEVAFEAGVKRLTSIHPDIVGRVGAVGPALELVPPAPAPSGNGPAPDGADGTGGRARPGRGGRDGARSARRGGNGPGPRHHDGHAQDGDDGHTRDGGAASDGFAPAPRARRDGAGQVLKHWPGFSNAVVQLDGSHRRLLQRYRRGALSSYREVRLRLKAAELAARLDPGELLAFDLARDVVRYAHQVDACRRVIGEMRGRALLADEVGLGKTIEAGIVLSEYRIRGLVRRALLLVPAALQSQWRSELWHKFGIRCHIRERGEDFDGHDFLITTLDTARVKRNQERILDNSYDLVIIDEAHRLKNHRTLSYQFASALASRYLLLLTATPVHNDLRELYNLVTLLRPGTLGTY